MILLLINGERCYNKSNHKALQIPSAKALRKLRSRGYLNLRVLHLWQNLSETNITQSLPIISAHRILSSIKKEHRYGLRISAYGASYVTSEAKKISARSAFLANTRTAKPDCITTALDILILRRGNMLVRIRLD